MSKNKQYNFHVNKVKFCNKSKIVLIAGPCALESRDHAFRMAEYLKNICSSLSINFVYKTSFDKANRSSIKSKRGIGLDKALNIFQELKSSLDISIITDVHSVEHCADVVTCA